MKKLKVLLVVFMLLSLVLINSCDMFNEILGLEEESDSTTDLVLRSVEPLLNGAEVAGVRLVIENTGSENQQVAYSILLSIDRTISVVTDTLVYVSSVEVVAGGEKQIDIGTDAHLNPYMNDHGITMTEGNYYIGVKLDPDDIIAEENETNNDGVSNNTFPIAASYLDGTVTFEISNADIYNDANVYFMVQTAGGSYPEDYQGGGSFAISSGSGSVLTQLDEGGEWVATGGESYELGWFIDVDNNYNIESLEGPGQGDIVGEMLEIPVLNGDTVVTLDLDVDFVYPSGAIVAEIDFPEAAGGEAVLFVAETNAYDFSQDPSVWIRGSQTLTLDENGYGICVLEEGYPPVESGSVFYPTLQIPYDYLGAIDVGGIVNEQYSDPYDYVDKGFSDGEGEAPRSFTSGDHNEVLHFSASDFDQQAGIIIQADSFGSSTFDNYDIRCNLFDQENGDLRGTGTILWSERESGNFTSVILNGDQSNTWADSAGTYDFQFYLDVDSSGTLSAGDLMDSFEIYYAETPMTLTLSPADLLMYIDGYLDLYSEDSSVNLGFSDENTTHDDSFIDENSPNDPSTVLRVSFSTTSFTWFHINISIYSLFFPADTEFVLNFDMNAQDALNQSADSLDYLVWDGNDTHNSANVFDPQYQVSAPDSNGWGSYSIPLKGNIYGEYYAYIDQEYIESIKFGCVRNESGGAVDCSIYFDNMSFDVVSQ